jgi:uncharacterized protein (DUF983 family)
MDEWGGNHTLKHTQDLPERKLLPAMVKGWRNRCPNCGRGTLFQRYLKTFESCNNCSQQLDVHSADDAPPYFVILIIGHVLIALIIPVEIIFQPPMWVHAILWIPVTIAVCLLSLQPVKGAVIGLQWAFSMHGFGDDIDTEREDHTR